MIYRYQILSETHDQNMITMQGSFTPLPSKPFDPRATSRINAQNHQVMPQAVCKALEPGKADNQ